MKRFICVLLSLSLMLSIPVYAEEESGGILGSIGGFFGNVVNGASKKIDETLDSAGAFANQAGEKISEKASQAGEAIKDTWDDASHYASDTWDIASEFIVDKGNSIYASVQSSLSDLSSWMSVTGSNALEILHGVFDVVAVNLGIASDKVGELWDAVYKYSVEKNINMVVLVKLSLAIMVRIALRGDTIVSDMAGDYIDEIVLGWFTDFGIESEEDAEAALNTIENSLEQSGIAEN